MNGNMIDNDLLSLQQEEMENLSAYDPAGLSMDEMVDRITRGIAFLRAENQQLKRKLTEME